MFALSDTTGYGSYGSTRNQNSDSEATITRKQHYKDLICKANSVPITVLFKYYRLHLDQYNRKITCPLSKHKGGKESTPSFWYYPETNSFWCFGCKTGRSPIDLVINLEDIPVAKAAYKILDLISEGDDLFESIVQISQNERLQLLVNFSSTIRNLIQINKNDADVISRIEKLTQVFDQMNTKHRLDNEALKSLIERLQEQLV
jgi:CHC2-type zinc finger protein